MGLDLKKSISCVEEFALLQKKTKFDSLRKSYMQYEFIGNTPVRNKFQMIRKGDLLIFVVLRNAE